MTPDAALISVRAVILIGTALVFGTSVFLMFVASGTPTRFFAGQLNAISRSASVAVLVAALFWPIVQTAVFSETWEAAADLSAQIALLRETSPGRAGIARAILAIALVLLIWRGAAQRPVSTAVLSGTLLANIASSGHAATQEGAAALPLAVNHVLHAIAGCGWLGAILPLIVATRLLRKAGGENAQFVVALERFSGYGAAMVSAVTVTGLINMLSIPGLAALTFRTAYHVLLAAKIACVAGMLVCAFFNRNVLVPRFKKEEPGSARRLELSMTVEMLLGIAALVLVAAFATLDPDGGDAAGS